MMRRRSRVKKAKKRKHARRRWPRLGSLIAGGFLAAFAGFIVLLVVYGAMSGGHGEFVPEITETRSESEAEPFQGGPRLHFPVASIDMGQVPLNTNVSYAFAMANVGDDAAHIEDIGVSVLEGC
jgi:ABC-type lipoprotein release transport system permease subunit